MAFSSAVASSSAVRLLEPSALDAVPVINTDRDPNTVEEIEGFLRVFKDGYVDRSSPYVSEVPPSPNQTPVISEDHVIRQSCGLWARIYVPAQTAKTTKLPVLVYYHGGGFCMGSASWSIYHSFLTRFALEANCIIISVNYRLAPEHRLPAQYEDGINALEWLHQQALSGDALSWVWSYGDFSRCFVAGDSSGANIVHHVLWRIGRDDRASSLKPLVIRGAVLVQPFFGGMNALEWEEETADTCLPRHSIDVYWRLSLPLGADRDHPACNPLPTLSKMEKVTLPPILLCLGERDVLRERNLEYYRALVKAGMNVRHVVFKGVGHAFHVLKPHSPRVPELTMLFAQFINQM